MIKMRTNIGCLQEKKWVREKFREIKNTRYSLWFTRKKKHRNGVGIRVSKKAEEKTMDIKRLGDRVIGINCF